MDSLYALDLFGRWFDVRTRLGDVHIDEWAHLGNQWNFGRFTANPKGRSGLRLAFLLSLAAAPILLSLVLPAGFIEAPRIEAGYGAIAIAGLLVGFGTRYGSGCTSGHGVCGLSRLSLRSLVSTLTFMAFGFLVVYVMRHVQ